MEYESLADELFHIMCQFSKIPCQEQPRNFATGEMAILFYLNSIQDGATAGEICNYLKVTTGRIASALNSLGKKHFIQRMSHADDRRKITVYITSSGREYILQNYEDGLIVTQNALENLGEDDAKELIRIMKKLMDI